MSGPFAAHGQPAVRKNDLKVGVFVLFGLVLAAVVVFLIGNERRLFERSVELRVEFDDVAGLRQGALVQMGGVRVGHVAAVGYGDRPDDPKIHVTLSIVSTEAKRILSDSEVTIVNKGLLGDKMLLITRGKNGRPIPSGGLVPSKEPEDLLGRFDQIAGSAESTFGNVGHLARALADDKLHGDIRGSAKALRRLLEQLTEGDGYPHRLLTQKDEGERISRAVDGVDRAAGELSGTLREVRLLVQQLRTGPGFAHDLLFGSGPQGEVAKVGAAAEELALTLRAVREGNGLAHDLLFGGRGPAGDALANLTELSADLRDVVRSIKQGKGTLGALLVDPSVYEDLKRLIGNVQRNAVLRSLVRYTLEKADSPPPAVGARP